MFFCCFSFVFSQAQLADGVLAHVGPNIVLYSTVLEEAFFQAQREGVDPQQNPDVFRDIFNSVLREKVRNNIVYIGNAFPHNYSDAGDTERGMMWLEWDAEPEFITWPEQPTYYNLYLTILIYQKFFETNFLVCN